MLRSQVQPLIPNKPTKRAKLTGFTMPNNTDSIQARKAYLSDVLEDLNLYTYFFASQKFIMKLFFKIIKNENDRKDKKANLS